MNTNYKTLSFVCVCFLFFDFSARFTAAGFTVGQLPILSDLYVRKSTNPGVELKMIVDLLFIRGIL